MHPFMIHRNYVAQLKQAAALNYNHAPKREREGFLRRWLHSASHSWKRRKMIASLRAMDDHLLRDIGFSRDNIGRIVDGFNERELDMIPLARTPSKAKQNNDVWKLAA